MKRLFLLLTLVSSLAADPLPSEGQPMTTNSFTYLTNTLDSFVQSGANLFVDTALNVLQGFGIWVLAFLLLVVGVESVIHRTIINPIPLLKFIWTYGLLTTSLHYYSTPLPLIGSSLHTVFSDAASVWSAQMNLQILTTLSAKIEALHAGMSIPGLTDLPGMFAYGAVIFLLSAASGIMQGITSFAFVALGIGAVLGPLSIMLAQLPWFRHLLMNWITYMFKYAMWRLVVSAVTYVWGNTLLAYFQFVVGKDYTAGHFLSILVGMITITISFVYALVMVPSLVNDLYGGSHSGGAASAGLVAMAARVFKKF